MSKYSLLLSIVIGQYRLLITKKLDNYYTYASIIEKYLNTPYVRNKLQTGSIQGFW